MSVSPSSSSSPSQISHSLLPPVVLAMEHSEEAKQHGVMEYAAAPPRASYHQSVPPNAQIAFQQAHHFHHHQQQQQQQQLQIFWSNQMHEIEQTTDFKNHTLPLARIKKIMKADEDVRMISAEAPVIFAKACEIFILELTMRAWIHTEENKRRTLQKNDIAAAISRTDVFDFLVDIIPRDELKEEGLGVTKGTIPTMVGSPPYYYLQQQQQQGMMPWPQGNPEQHHDE